MVKASLKFIVFHVHHTFLQRIVSSTKKRGRLNVIKNGHMYIICFCEYVRPGSKISLLLLNINMEIYACIITAKSTLTDLRGAQGMYRWGTISSIFMQFSGKFGQIGLTPQPLGLEPFGISWILH